MVWQCQNPANRVSDVASGQRVGVGIDVVGSRVIALESNVGKLSAPTQARLDRRHSYFSPCKIGAQIQAELMHGRFCCTVDISDWIRIGVRCKPQIDNPVCLTLYHVWHRGVSAVHQPTDVDNDHFVPIIERRLFCRIQPQCQACVIDQCVDRAHLTLSCIDRGERLIARRNIERASNEALA